MSQVTPGRDQNSSSRKRYSSVPQYDQHAHDHSSPSTIASKYNVRGVLDSEEVEIRSQTVVETARKGELRCKSVSWSENPSLQLPGMSLHLVPMFIDTPKEVCPAMHIQHDSGPLIIRFPSLIIVGFHLNPFTRQLTPRSPPLPPGLASDFLDSMMSQLLVYQICRLLDVFLVDFDFFGLDPCRMRYPLGSKALDFFDCVVRGIDKELPN